MERTIRERDPALITKIKAKSFKESTHMETLLRLNNIGGESCKHKEAWTVVLVMVLRTNSSVIVSSGAERSNTSCVTDAQN